MNETPERSNSSVNGELDSKPRNYFEALRALGEYYFAAWPDERDAILADHVRDRDELSATFGVSLQQIAEQLGNDPSDEDFLNAVTRIVYPGRNPDDIRLDEFDKCEPFLHWLMLEKGRFGGPLGSKLTVGHAPIFSPSEILAFDANDDFADRPPVTVLPHFANADSSAKEGVSKKSITEFTESLTTRLAAWTWRDSSRPISRDRMPTGEVLDRFDDLTAALSEVIRLQVPMRVGVEGPEVRAAYRAFARVFHPWAIEAIVTPDDEPLSLPIILAKQTFGPIARMEQAFAETKGFKLNRDGSALVHRYYNAKTRKVDPIEVVLAPIESSQWFPTSTVEELQRKPA